MLPERLEVVCTQSLAWGMREQEPKRHGTTDVQICLCLTLTASEEANVRLDPEEYVESRWIRPADILEGNFHPALQFAVSSLLAVLKLQARSLFGPHASSWRDGSKETAAKRERPAKKKAQALPFRPTGAPRGGCRGVDQRHGNCKTGT